MWRIAIKKNVVPTERQKADLVVPADITVEADLLVAAERVKIVLLLPSMGGRAEVGGM